VKTTNPAPLRVVHCEHLIAAVIDVPDTTGYLILDSFSPRVIATAVLGLYGWSIAWRDDRTRLRQHLLLERSWAEDTVLALARHRISAGRHEAVLPWSP
jgi:hypothetical protein